jgi:hypothetical protein
VAVEITLVLGTVAVAEAVLEEALEQLFLVGYLHLLRVLLVLEVLVVLAELLVIHLPGKQALEA